VDALENDGEAPRVIGWKEAVDLPEWGVTGLLAKADTGARGSALDVERIEKLDEGTVRFAVALDRRDRTRTREITVPIAGLTRIRSSNGTVQERVKVMATIRMGGAEHPVEFSLVNRRRMICRILLGRRALAGAYLVDSGDKYIHGPRRRSRAKPAPKRKRKRPETDLPSA